MYCIAIRLALFCIVLFVSVNKQPMLVSNIIMFYTFDTALSKLMNSIDQRKCDKVMIQCMY